MNKKNISSTEAAIKKELERLYKAGAFKEIERLILDFATSAENFPARFAVQFNYQAFVPNDESSAVEGPMANLAVGHRGKDKNDPIPIFGLF